jgi:ribonuclease D
VTRGLDLPESQLPELRRPLDDPPQVGVLAQLLGVLTNSLAGRHQVDAGMLATTADLQELVRWRLGLTPAPPAALLEGWRGEVLGQALIDLLDGKRSVRVGDLQSPSPLLIEPAEE